MSTQHHSSNKVNLARLHLPLEEGGGHTKNGPSGRHSDVCSPVRDSGSAPLGVEKNRYDGPEFAIVKGVIEARSRRMSTSAALPSSVVRVHAVRNSDHDKNYSTKGRDWERMFIECARM